MKRSPCPGPLPTGGDFAPRFHELHRALDEAVCAACGREVAVLDDEEVLRRLLAPNPALGGWERVSELADSPLAAMLSLTGEALETAKTGGTNNES